MKRKLNRIGETCFSTIIHSFAFNFGNNSQIKKNFVEKRLSNSAFNARKKFNLRFIFYQYVNGFQQN